MFSNTNLATLSSGILFGLIASQHYDAGMAVCASLAIVSLMRAVWFEARRTAATPIDWGRGRDLVRRISSAPPEPTGTPTMKE